MSKFTYFEFVLGQLGAPTGTAANDLGLSTRKK